MSTLRYFIPGIITVLLTIGGATSCERHTSQELQAKGESQTLFRICDTCDDVFYGEDTTCPQCVRKQCPGVLEEMHRLMCRLWSFAEAMRVQDRPYGYFRWSRSAYDEYNTMASYMALLGYNTLSRLGYRPPLSQDQLEEWRETVESWFSPETGLIEDPLPVKRLGTSSEYESLFFTYTERWLTRLRDAGVPGRFAVPKRVIQQHDVFADVVKHGHGWRARKMCRTRGDGVPMLVKTLGVIRTSWLIKAKKTAYWTLSISGSMNIRTLRPGSGDLRIPHCTTRWRGTSKS